MHATVGGSALALSHHCPVVADGAPGQGDAVKVGQGRDPADVADVGAGVAVSHHDVAHIGTGLVGFGTHGLEGLAVLQFLFRVIQGKELLHVGQGQLVDGIVGVIVGIVVDQLRRQEGGARHQGRAAADVQHALIQFPHIGLVRVAQDVKALRVLLDDVGRRTAGIGDGIVHDGVLLHVLPQEVQTHIGQFQRVQRAPAQLGPGSMGRLALEAEIGRHDGQAFLHHFPFIAGMPGDRRVHVVKLMVQDQEDLAAAALFRRAGIVADGAGQALLL